MGEAKRRKKLDPNYGKSVELTIFDFAVKMHDLYGKGLVYLHEAGLGYVLPSHSDISDIDKALMDEADYKTRFVVTMLMTGGLFTTGIFDRGDLRFALLATLTHFYP